MIEGLSTLEGGRSPAHLDPVTRSIATIMVGAPLAVLLEELLFLPSELLAQLI